MKLKSGQINFEMEPGVYHCVVIRDGRFCNLRDEDRKILLGVLEEEKFDLEDLF